MLGFIFHRRSRAIYAPGENEAAGNRLADRLARLVPDVKAFLDAEAEKLAKAWLDEYRVAIKGLSDERQEAYRQINSVEHFTPHTRTDIQDWRPTGG